MTWARVTFALPFAEVIERLDMSVFIDSYSGEGGELYAPELMLGRVALRLRAGHHQRAAGGAALVEDLAFRYLAAGERVDNWALERVPAPSPGAP